MNDLHSFQIEGANLAESHEFHSVQVGVTAVYNTLLHSGINLTETDGGGAETPQRIHILINGAVHDAYFQTGAVSRYMDFLCGCNAAEGVAAVA